MRVNRQLTFAAFCETSSNASAYQRCIHFVCERPDVGGILILHGPTAAGKTHLLHAIGNLFRDRKEPVRLRLESCEQWNQKLVEALYRHRSEEVLAEYCSLDVFLMDDVDLGAEFKQTREMLWRIVSSICSKGGCVALAGLDPLARPARRLGNEMSQPVFVRLNRPSLEDLIAIVSHRIRIMGRKVDQDLVRFACRHARGDLRRAEGLLNTMLFAEQLHRELGMQGR